MKKIIVLTATAMSLIFTTTAFASDSANYGNATGQWINRDTVKEIVSGQGYNVRRIKREDGCYEVYAIGKSGKRVEAKTV